MLWTNSSEQHLDSFGRQHCSPKMTSDEKTLKVKLFSFYYSGAAIKWNEFFDAHFQYTKSYANIKAECESLAALHMYMRGWYWCWYWCWCQCCILQKSRFSPEKSMATGLNWTHCISTFHIGNNVSTLVYFNYLLLWDSRKSHSNEKKNLIGIRSFDGSSKYCRS